MKKLILTNLCFLLLSTPVYSADEDSQNKEMSDQENSQQDNSDNSAENSAALTERFTPDPHKQQQLEIAQLLKGSLTETVELNALDQTFNLYLLSADEKEPLGSVLLFADPRTHSDWPISLSPLRVGLTHHKWQTAVMELPALQLAKIPDRSPLAQQNSSDGGNNSEQDAQQGEQTDQEETTEQAAPATTEQTDTSSEETAPPNSEQAILARAQASIEKLKETTDTLILIGIGQGATWATAYANTLTEADKEKNRLILINAQQSDDMSAPDLNQMIRDLKIDTFDVYSAQNKTSTGINQSLARKRAANQSDIENYRQIKAPKSAWNAQGNEWLYRKVLGLIKVNISVQIEAELLEKNKPKPAEKINQKPGA